MLILVVQSLRWASVWQTEVQLPAAACGIHQGYVPVPWIKLNHVVADLLKICLTESENTAGAYQSQVQTQKNI